MCVSRPFHYLSTTIMTIGSELFLIITYILAHVYTTRKDLPKSQELPGLDILLIINVLVYIICCLGFVVRESWQALSLWKAAKENPFNRVANYSKSGKERLREASEKLYLAS